MNGYELGFDEIEIQTDAAKLGEGFNSLNLSRRPQARLFPKGAIAKPKPEDLETPTLETEFFVAESSRELAARLNINAQAAAKVAQVGSAGVSAEYLDEENFSENNFIFCFQGRAISRRESLVANPELIKSAPGYLSDPETLLGTFGDYYCSELVYGGELIISVTVTTQNSSQKKEIASKLKASFSKAQADLEASASYKKSFSDATTNAKTTVRLYQVGSIEGPQDQTFATCIDYAFEYFEKEHTNNLMRAVYRPVTQLPGLQQDVRKELTKTLKPLWEKRDKFLEWLGGYQQAVHDYEAALSSESDYYLPTNYYAPIRKDIDASLAGLKKELKRNAGGMDLCDPEEVIRKIKKCPPDYYLEKLKDRRIQSSALWGGIGGVEFDDPVKDLEGITKIELTSDNRSGLVIGRLTIALLKHGGDIQVTQHGSIPTKSFFWDPDPAYTVWPSISLNKGDWIESVEVKADTFVRQIKFGIRRKGKPELEEVALPPNVTQGVSNKMENIIVVGFRGRSGAFLDALGIRYIELK